MKTYITALFILLCGSIHAQKQQKQPDSVRVIYDKNGNMYRNVYYSTPKKGNSVDIGYGSKKKKKKKQPIIIPYAGHGTAPTAVGSYALTVIPRMPCVECEVAKMHLKAVIIFAIMIVLCYIGIFIHDMTKSEEITIPT